MRWNNRVGDDQLRRGVRKGQTAIEPNDTSFAALDLGRVVTMRPEMSMGDGM